MRKNERRPPEVLDDVRDRHRFARSGYSEERLEAITALEPAGQLGDCVRLVSGWLEGCSEIEFGAGHPRNIIEGLRFLFGSANWLQVRGTGCQIPRAGIRCPGKAISQQFRKSGIGARHLAPGTAWLVIRGETLFSSNLSYSLHTTRSF